MYHGDLHIGNILINDKEQFVIIDFERCVPHRAFVDIEEKKLLCYLEKLFVFRLFFDLTANTGIESHKAVRELFVNYFTDQLKQLNVNAQWNLLFFNLLLGNFNADESYSQLVFQTKSALEEIFNAKHFMYNSQLFTFHHYLDQKRFMQI